ncbi:flagellar biosynthesis protein FlhB [Candidatus Magnetoovum chiemensis]|nr:flagellar biosynthesis protein FlhB [Candidatus Magnetoovum chiemensis]
MPGGGEKSEQATPRRRQKAREKGKIAKSREVTSLATMFGIMLVIIMGARYFLDKLAMSTERLLSIDYKGDLFAMIKTAQLSAADVVLPILVAAVAMALVSELAQVGFLFKSLELNFGKVNPLGGIKKLFSLNGILEFLKSLLKFAAGALIIYFMIKVNLHSYPDLMTKEMSQLIPAIAGFLKKALFYGFIYLLIIAIITFILNKYSHERSLKMSKEEIKEEVKESEGDPKIKARIRRIQAELSRKRMMAEVPKATVVITNPTHIAVALKYKERETYAPKLVAKGAGHIAEKIKEIAKKNNIPIVEDKPLARALFQVELNHVIPPELYKAVAKILAYIYKLNNMAR